MRTLTRSFMVLALLAMAGFTVESAQAGEKAYTAQTAKQMNIVETAQSAGQFETLVAAVIAADLVSTLTDNELTVFAPTDEAFAKLPAGVVAKLLEADNKDLLTELLAYHVVIGTVKAEDVVQLKSAATFGGEEVRISYPGKKRVQINNAKVTTADVLASNGVIHIVDTVLVPKNFIGRLNSR